MKLTEELKKQAAEHFRVLKHEDTLYVTPQGQFFLLPTEEEAYKKLNRDKILTISRKDAADYLGDELYL
ncbi:hypothetical protein V6R21_24170 [Limibacter armeniacum]|uniref:hypothetical protein n=1 Tax=Limibacter armeniacum TaxID=466084 RepID=UPI002FE658B7